MSSSSPQPIPLALKPDSVYIVFIMEGDRICPGVFHHSSDHRGKLAYAGKGPDHEDGKFSCKIFSFRLWKRIETEFTVILAQKIASLHYHKCLPNDIFASFSLLSDQDLWMMEILRRLGTKQWMGELVWVNYLWLLPPEFKELGTECFPSTMQWLMNFCYEP